MISWVGESCYSYAVRYAVVADVHSNLDAFNAVLEDLEQRGGTDEIWCLGDVVGYGPEPHECIERLRGEKHICVAGNHDLAAIGKIDTSDFNPHAAAAARWTSEQLTGDDIAYLSALPLRMTRDGFTLVHGSPREPVWEYILSVPMATENFACFETPFCLVGHSHVPLVFWLDEKGVCRWKPLQHDATLALGKERLIINPGGAGQPRDGDARAGYAIYDSDAASITLYRVSYDIGATQAKMRSRRLPPWLAERLSHGI